MLALVDEANWHEHTYIHTHIHTYIHTSIYPTGANIQTHTHKHTDGKARSPRQACSLLPNSPSGTTIPATPHTTQTQKVAAPTATTHPGPIQCPDLTVPTYRPGPDKRFPGCTVRAKGPLARRARTPLEVRIRVLRSCAQGMSSFGCSITLRYCDSIFVLFVHACVTSWN